MLSSAMAKALRSSRRDLCWLFWFEGDGSDLYAWSGLHTLTYDGQSWLGVGHVLGMSPITQGDAMAFRTQQFALKGLDPQVLAELDESVQGRGGKVWLACRNSAGQVIPDPLLIADVTQDTLNWSIENGNTVKLALNTFESLVNLGQPSGRKWSHESQLERFPGDTGFKYTQKIARTGLSIDWRPAA